MPPARLSAMPDLDSAIGVLLSVARAVKDELYGRGGAVTRDALAARLRRRGYHVRNSTVTILLREFRGDSPQPLGAWHNAIACRRKETSLG